MKKQTLCVFVVMTVLITSHNVGAIATDQRTLKNVEAELNRQEVANKVVTGLVGQKFVKETMAQSVVYTSLRKHSSYKIN